MKMKHTEYPDELHHPHCMDMQMKEILSNQLLFVLILLSRFLKLVFGEFNIDFSDAAVDIDSILA